MWSYKSNRKIIKFIKFTIVWVACNLSIPFWMVGHVHLTLKFTPRTYKISMWGYGGEKVMGTVDQTVWDYCIKNQVDLSEIAWGDEDTVQDEMDLDLDMLPFPPGSWYECDNLAHTNGVSRNAGTLQIEDENGNIICEKSLDAIVGGGCDGEPDWSCTSPSSKITRSLSRRE